MRWHIWHVVAYVVALWGGMCMWWHMWWHYVVAYVAFYIAAYLFQISYCYICIFIYIHILAGPSRNRQLAIGNRQSDLQDFQQTTRLASDYKTCLRPRDVHPTTSPLQIQIQSSPPNKSSRPNTIGNRQQAIYKMI